VRRELFVNVYLDVYVWTWMDGFRGEKTFGIYRREEKEKGLCVTKCPVSLPISKL